MVSNDSDPPSDTTPLLPHADCNSDSEAAQPPDPTKRRYNQPSHLFAKYVPSQRAVIVILVLLYLISMDLGYELILPAQTRVFEKIFCTQYYREHDPSLIGSDGRDGVNEKWCKIKEIQGQLAMLKGWQVTFDSIGMLVFSVPWAYVADTHGRKPVILLLAIALFAKYSYVQLICYLGGSVPLRFSWLSSLHTIFGGSVTVGTALIYTILSDVLAEQQRLAVFFQVQAGAIATQFLGSLLSAALMVWNPWIPMLLGLCMESIGIAILFLIPETLGYKKTTIDSDSESSSLGVEDSEPTTLINASHVDPASDTETDNSPSWTWRESPFRRVPRSISFLVSDIRIFLIVAIFSVHMLFSNRDILLQYISSRYQVNLAQATALVSIRSGLAFLLCVVVLPVANIYCRSRLFDGRAQRSDIFLARTSSIFLALGFLGIGLAPNLPLLVASLVVNSLSWGLWSLLRSLSTDLVRDAGHVARLNSFIGIVDTVGLMVGSPLLAALFTKGMELGGPWRGLPFVVCAGAVAVLALILGCVQV